MTKNQIIERLKAAGVKGWDKKNLAELEALAAANGVSLVEGDAGDKPADEGETLAMVGERGAKVRPALEGGGFQAVCEEFPELVGFGETREAAVEDLAAAIVAKLEAEAVDAAKKDAATNDRAKAEAMLTDAGHSLDLLLFQEDGGKFGIAVAVNHSLNGVADSWEEAARELLEELATAKADKSVRPPQGPTGEPHSESADHDGLSRLITPQMACSVFPGPGEAKEEKE